MYWHYFQNLTHTSDNGFFLPSINTATRFREHIAISFRQILLEFGAKFNFDAFTKRKMYFLPSGSLNFDSNLSEDALRVGGVEVGEGGGGLLGPGANGANAGSGPVTHPRQRWRCMQPRLCNYCWKTFSNSFNLKQHIVNVHIQSQGVNCNICDKVVKNKWYLRKHLVTAHGAPLKRSKNAENTNGITNQD